jgi:hypothetical protein
MRCGRQQSQSAAMLSNNKIGLNLIIATYQNGLNQSLDEARAAFRQAEKASQEARAQARSRLPHNQASAAA